MMLTEDLHTNEEIDAARSLLMLLHSPKGAFASIAPEGEVPPLDLQFLTSLATAAEPTKNVFMAFEAKPNVKSLINILEEDLPSISKASNKARRRSSLTAVSSANLHRSSAARKRSTTFDEPVKLLPRLRSHSRRRRSSVTYQRRSKQSIDSEGALSEPSNTMRSSLTPIFEGKGRMIGAYDPVACKALIERFLAKRKKRVWTKKIKYEVRKNFADSRLRVKGRFISKGDESTLRETLMMFM